jgi:type IV pilus assembly protein PilO
MATPAKPSAIAKLGAPAKVGVGTTFVVLVALAYWVIFYSDISMKIDSANVAQNKLRGDLAEQQQVQASYLADKDELVFRQQRQRELNKALPADTEAADFLSSLQQAANVSGVELKTWAPQDEKTESFYAKFPMRLEMTGHFHQVAKFAYEVGRVERIINVENIEMGEPKVEGDDIVVKARCLATTFHTIKPKGPAAAPGAPPPAPAAGGTK